MSKQNVSILVCEPMAALGLALLRDQANFTVEVAHNLSRDDLLTKIATVDALLIRSQTKVDKEILTAARNLKLIGRAGVGIDNIDIDFAQAQGITVINTPSGNSISAAELAFSLMLCLARKIVPAHSHVQKYLWDRKQFSGVELYGKTLGIVGFGNVGRNLALRAKAFSMRVICYDPWIEPSVAHAHDVEVAPLSEVYCQADFLSLHCALSADTKNMINVQSINTMKRGIMLINTARGELIDDNALLCALDSGHIKSAALDVFRKEPPNAHDPLLSHPHIIVTPHLGAFTEEAQLRVSTLVAEQTIAFFGGNTVARVV